MDSCMDKSKVEDFMKLVVEYLKIYLEVDLAILLKSK